MGVPERESEEQRERVREVEGGGEGETGLGRRGLKRELLNHRRNLSH